MRGTFEAIDDSLWNTADMGGWYSVRQVVTKRRGFGDERMIVGCLLRGPILGCLAPAPGGGMACLHSVGRGSSLLAPSVRLHCLAQRYGGSVLARWKAVRSGA